MKQPIPIAILFFSMVGLTTGCDNNDDDIELNSDNPLVDSSSIDSTINEFMTSNDVVGLSVATVKKTADETLIWTNQYGHQNRELQTPVDGDTSFWMGSVSKAVMGTALMIANENGFLLLDDDIHAALNNQGDFILNNPDQQSISVAHLASHTSGIVDEDETYACAYYVPMGDGEHKKLVNMFDIGITCPEQSPVNLAGYLGAYLDAEGEFYSVENNFNQSPPGELSEYSNIGAGLAGHLVELTTGQDLAAYADQEIFTPLAMSNTSWNIEKLQLENIATPYMTTDDGLVALPIYELATWPDGGLRSNAADLAKLLGVVINKGQLQTPGVRLLSEASIERMLPAAEAEYGLFWGVEGNLTIEDNKRAVIGHSGSDPGAFSVMVFDRISESGVVFVGNGEDDDIDDSTFENLLEALFKSAAEME